MSKSDVDQRSRILLTDCADTVRDKVRKAVTDCTPFITYDPCGRPGVSNLVDIASAMSGLGVEEVCECVRHMDTVQFKNHVTDLIVERLKPVRGEVSRLLSDRDHLCQVVSEGNERAAVIADRTYCDVRRLVGFT